MSAREENLDKQPDLEFRKLISCLLDAVKQCQRRFGGKKELATDDDSCVSCLCAQLESVLQHGLRKSVSLAKSGATATADSKISVIEVVSKSFKSSENSSDIVFWHFVREFLSRHEQERYYLLNNISTDIGRGRAWLRSTLNEHSLERYLHILLGDPDLLNRFYMEYALMRNQEFSTMLPNMAAGLGSILFAININNSDLNSFRDTSASSSLSSSISSGRNSQEEPKPVILSSSGKERCKKKRVPAQIAIFDDDDDEESNLAKVSCSAPSTCLSSPVDLYSRYCTNYVTRLSLSKSKAEFDHSQMPNLNELGGVSAVDVKHKSNSDPEFSLLGRFHSEENLVSHRDDKVENGFKENSFDNRSIYSPVALGGFACMEETKKVDLSSSEDEDKLAELEGENSNGSKGSKLMDEISHTNPSHWCSGANLHQSKRPLVMCSGGDHSRSSVLEPLTPINDVSVGELFPVGNNEEIHSEDSVSIPSYSEDTENAALGLALAQKALRNNVTARVSDQCSGAIQPPVAGSTNFQKTDDLTSDELKQALLTVMQKKDELEEQNCSLRSLLDKEMEMSACLRVENESLKSKYQDMVAKVQNRLHTVTRENELLKHQLRKYIGAVQVLKRNGTEAHEALACLNRESVLGMAERHNYYDYHLEATEYEKKLIQVAEMHGELMEFNDRLHRLLSQKELDVRRLREELVELRGPFPDDGLTSDDDISITSDYDTSSLTAAARSHINVWIPSVFLTGRSSDVHHVYQVYIRIRDDEWNIYRRYAQFYALHRDLRRKIAPVNTFDFPPKKVIGNKDAKFVEERRKRLQHYLRCVVNLIVQNNSELATNPDKTSLTALLPFFSEFANNQMGQRRSQRRSVHNFFSRQSTQSQEESPSSHYAGL